MRRQNVTYDDLCEASGVRRCTLRAWSNKNKPGLDAIEAVLGTLGWDFVPIPRQRVLPAALVEALTPIAAAHDLSMTRSIEALLALVTRIHERRPCASEQADQAPSTAPSLSELVLRAAGL